MVICVSSVCRVLLALTLSLLAAPTVAGPLRFAWPAPAQALVTVEASKAGRIMSSSLTLKVSRDAEGLTRLDFADARLLTVDGRDLPPGEEHAFGPLAAAMPSLLIGKDGRVQKVLGLGRLAEALVADSPEAKRADLRRALASPKLRAELEAKAGEDWNGWVGVWLGREVPAGGRLALTATTEVLGDQVQSRGSIADLGRVEGDPAGAVRLRLELTADGPDLARAVFGALERMARDSGQPLGGLGLDKVETASRRDFVVLVADRSTLRPYRVETGTQSVFKLRGEAAQRQSETKSFRFDWR